MPPNATGASVDDGEVQRHSDLMSTWWSPRGELRGLIFFNELRVPFIAESLVPKKSRQSSSKPLAGKKILEELAKLGAEVTGVDPSSNLIGLAQEHSKVDPRVAANRPTYLNTTIEEHSAKFPDHYDAVIASEVLEHVADVNIFLECCVAALKPGGKIFLTSPTRTRLGQFLVMVVGIILTIVPKNLMTYSKFTRPDEITDILERNNCEVDEVRGLFYYPFIDKWQWVFFKSLWYRSVIRAFREHIICFVWRSSVLCDHLCRNLVRDRMSHEKLSTVDEGEVNHHANLMQSWWEPNGSLKGLHSLNRIRIPLVLDALTTPAQRSGPKPLANIKLLDIGCGGGIVAEALAKLGAQVTGVDPSSILIDLAREHSKVEKEVAANKPTYYCTTIEEHSEHFSEYYDGVVATEVVDHVADVDLFLKHCCAVLKPGGKIFITAPNRTRLSQFLVIFVAENIINMIPKGTHTYEKFIRPEEVSAILQKYDCKVDWTYGMFYLPFFDRWLWLYFQAMWYGLVATKAPK
ncbi:unnamed protein product [Leptosia nina]|uniref:Ubiquinone biosynthesis O-methyltransferase, mitochondrial n=1 Tax=Leptosia nina TaxID=320188 RepID=A0AAV1JMW6_9NEOP